jgi:hypothetical protein
MRVLAFELLAEAEVNTAIPQITLRMQQSWCIIQGGCNSRVILSYGLSNNPQAHNTAM